MRGFHVSLNVCITGPRTLTGFPSTRTEASSIDRRPCLVDFCSERFALWGCPVEHNMASGPSPPRGVYFKFRICEIRMLARAFWLRSVVGRRVCPVGFTGDLRVGFPQTTKRRYPVFSQLGCRCLRAAKTGREQRIAGWERHICGCSLHGRRSPRGSDMRHLRNTIVVLIFMFHTPHSLADEGSREA